MHGKTQIFLIVSSTESSPPPHRSLVLWTLYILTRASPSIATIHFIPRRGLGRHEPPGRRRFALLLSRRERRSRKRRRRGAASEEEEAARGRRREEAAAERRAGEVVGDAVRGGEEVGVRPEAAPRRRARARPQAGLRLVPEPPGAAQEQAGGGGLPQAPGRTRRHAPRKVPPRERGAEAERQASEN